jgi:ankyrin repeat protein
MAVVNGHSTAVRLCLEAGADPNQRVPVHRHAMPLHQAALRDDVEAMKLLVAHGARLDERDTLWDGTPLGWAVHNGCRNAEAYLRALQEGSG